MKVKYLILSLAGVFAFSASAQNMTKKELPAGRTAFERGLKGNWRKNWFVTIQLGAGANFLDQNQDVKLGDRIAITPSFSFGKWHTPYFATRFQVNGIIDKTFVHKERMDERFIGGHFDFMFDVVSFFNPYKEDRVFRLVPFVGLGYAHKFTNRLTKKAYSNCITEHAGVQMGFKVSKHIDIVLEAMAVASNLNLDHGMKYFKNGLYDGLYGQVTAGLNFNLGGSFMAIEPMDFDLVNNLNSQINNLRAENEELSKRPVSCPECPEVTTTTTVKEIDNMTTKAILFPFNKSVVTKDQYINLFDVADFINKTGMSIIVTGYADHIGGDSKYNERLSEKRAKAVAKLLIQKYNVPSEKITVQWKGASEKVYDKTSWNRVTVIESAKQ